MSIAKDKNDLESLLYGAPQPSQTTGVKVAPKTQTDVDAETEVVSQQPIFSFDYETEMKAFKEKCKKTVMAMANHVLSAELLKNDYIKDKIEQDILTLAELYWARRSNELIKLAIMDSISKGNTAPRMFDSYNGVCDKISDNNKQIIATENNLRKTYLDLKYELMSKDEEEAIDNSVKCLPNSNQTIKTINMQSENISEPIIMRGSKDLLTSMKENLKMQMRQNINDNTIDVPYTEN